MLDPVVVDAVVNTYRAGGYNYYGITGSFPDGLDVEVFHYEDLARAWREATLKFEREHVGTNL